MNPSEYTCLPLLACVHVAQIGKHFNYDGPFPWVQAPLDMSSYAYSDMCACEVRYCHGWAVVLALGNDRCGVGFGSATVGVQRNNPSPRVSSA